MSFSVSGAKRAATSEMGELVAGFFRAIAGLLARRCGSLGAGSSALTRHSTRHRSHKFNDTEGSCHVPVQESDCSSSTIRQGCQKQNIVAFWQPWSFSPEWRGFQGCHLQLNSGNLATLPECVCTGLFGSLYQLEDGHVTRICHYPFDSMFGSTSTSLASFLHIVLLSAPRIRLCAWLSSSGSCATSRPSALGPRARN